MGVANEATTIGQRLRQARLNRNISLDELQQITKIQKRYLEAIERGDLDQLPGAFYVRAFVKQYAAVVGEDGDRLVAVLDGKEDIVPDLPKRPRPETVQGSRKSLHVEEPSSRWKKMLPVIVMGLIALLIVGFVAYMTWQDRNADPMIVESSVTVEGSLADSSTKESSSKAESSSSKTEESTTETTESSEEKKMAIKMDSNTQAEANMSITDAESPIELSFTGTQGPCWVGVTINGGYVYQYTVQAGETQTTTLPENAENATIILGASGNMSIKANDQDLDFTDPNLEALRKNINLTIQYQQAED